MVYSICKVYDEAGTKLISYEYNAYGKCYESYYNGGNSTSAVNNPFRYRGYYYDADLEFYYVCSRYYDPEIGRWISADDQIAGVGGEILGCNLFAYCMNNPVNMYDPTGNWPKWFKNSVKWVAKNIVKPIVKTVENALSDIDLTYSAGVNVSGTPSAWIFNGQIGVSVDTEGNIAIQASGGGGITGGNHGISITYYQSITNAPNIDKLNGKYYQTGGSIAAQYIAVGGDIMFTPDNDLNTVYWGLTGNVGFGTPGKEFHTEWGTTVTVWYAKFNIYDIARSIYSKIMEW